jgi:hypothetical protein
MHSPNWIWLLIIAMIFLTDRNSFNKNRYLSWVLSYVRFFFGFLGFIFLSQELWNWFPGDSLLRNAVTVTISIMLVDWGRLLFKKFTQKKDKSV